MAEPGPSTSAPKKTEQDDLRAATFKRLHPKVYLERFLAENFRPDGRQLDVWREVSLIVGSCGFPARPGRRLGRICSRPYALTGSISTADGSALVRVGKTAVVCGVKAEIAEPELDSPEDGFLGECAPSMRNVRAVTHLVPVPNLDLPAICHPRFKPGPPTEEAQVLSDRLNEVLVTSVLPSRMHVRSTI